MTQRRFLRDALFSALVVAAVLSGGHQLADARSALGRIAIAIVPHSPLVGEKVLFYAAPWGYAQAYQNDANLASLANGARPAVAKDQLAGWEHQNPTLHLNDGWYGHAKGWIGNSPNSWVKIDLGRERYIGRVRIGRDRTGSIIDKTADLRYTGDFRISVAAADDVYELGHDANDAAEYQQVFDSAAVAFKGTAPPPQSIEARFPGVYARFVKIELQNNESALDEVEVFAPDASAANACLPRPAGLVASWRANTTARDSVSHFHGALANGAAFAPGRVRQAFSFDGVDDYVELPADAALLGLTQGTLEFWARIESLTTDPVRLFAAARRGAAFPESEQWAVDYRSDGSLEVSLTGGGEIRLGTFTPTGIITDTEWHHIAIVADGAGSLDVYVDGIAQPLADGFVGGSGPDLFLGHAVGADNLKIGAIERDAIAAEGVKQIDEVSLYDRPLSASEIRALFAFGEKGKCFSNHPPAITVPNQESREGDTVSLAIAASDEDGDSLTYSAVGLLPGLSLDAGTGLITGRLGQPALGDHRITLLATDGIDSMSADVEWVVRLNQAPTAVADAASVERGKTVVIDVLANDTDAESDPLVITSVSQPPAGSVQIAPGGGTLTFESTGTVAGDVAFDYEVSDDRGARATGHVSVTVTTPPIVLLEIVESIGVSDGLGVTRAVMLDIEERIAVEDSPSVTPAVMLAVDEAIGVSDKPDVAPVPFDTAAGRNVRVTPAASSTTAPPVTMSFSNVVAPGYTSVAVNPPGTPAPPNGFGLGTPPVVLDITTTAQFSGAITVCINYGGSGFANPRSLRLFHFENGKWVDVTTAVDTVRKTICGSVTSLSPFGVFDALDPIPGRVSGAGAISAARQMDLFSFHVAEGVADRTPEFLQYLRVTPGAGHLPRFDRFVSTSIDWIAFTGNPSPRASSRPLSQTALFAGLGRWNGVDGFSFEARADVAANRNGRDAFAMTVRDAAGTVVGTFTGTLTNGNLHFKR
jgi:hypothetical protein